MEGSETESSGGAADGDAEARDSDSEDDEDDDVGDSAASNLSRGSEDGDSDEEMWAHVPDILPIPDDVMEGVPEGAGDRDTCML